MTCIVGIKNKGKVYIGGDSAGVNSRYDIAARLDPKVFLVDDMAIGYCGSFRMGQLLRYIDPPKHKKGVDDFQYMVTQFVPLIRKTFTDGGYNKKDKEQDEGGLFLIGYRGHLYSIESDYQVAENVDAYDAIGCAYGYALGSLYHTTDLSPEERINKALEAAEHFSAGVISPYLIVNTKKGKE